MRVAIIGSGGAGITAAWLLDGHHKVTLYERNPILGGHAHTTVVERDGKLHYADDGFGWFSDALYPRFMRLLEIVGVPTRLVPMSLAFTQTRVRRTLLLPPGPVDVLRLLGRPRAARDLLRLDGAIRAGAAVVHERNRLMTWGEFIRRHRFPEPFCSEVLTPIVAGVWGGPYERIEDFSAYTLMKYLVYHRPSALRPYRWHVVRDGAASYVWAVAAQLQTCTILRQCAVARCLPREGGWTIEDRHGTARDFDHLIMAAGAPDARNILADHPALARIRAALGSFEYYTVRIATHSDASFMPPRRADWRVANITADGARSSLTVWTGAHNGSEVFTSYLGDREPRECHHISTFRLPLMTPDHHRGQERVAALQGQEHLSFVGDWTRDIGSHEDAVTSALLACRALDSQLPRLAALESPRRFSAMTALPGRAEALIPA